VAKLAPVGIRQPDLEDDKIDMAGIDPFERPGSVVGFDHLEIPGQAELFAKAGTQVCVRIDKKDLLHRAHLSSGADPPLRKDLTPIRFIFGFSRRCCQGLIGRDHGVV
jgi:hypothetical protein